MTEELLDVDDVHQSYGEERVLEGISFEMDRQDVKVLVGPSGSGKSTMLRCINRLTDIDEGDIDMKEIVRVLKRYGYEGPVLPDHTPQMSCDAPWHAGMAYAMGYINALLEGA